MVQRSRRSVGATIAAGRTALAEGVSANLAGGTHHASADKGAGYCVFNDVAVAARLLQAETHRLHRRLLRVAVIDLDVHQGNGTAAIFRDDPTVFTLSLHGDKNYPFRKEVSDLDVGLPDGCRDEAYLAALDAALQSLWHRHRDSPPGLIFYLAGADPHEGDRLGRLKISAQGLAERDRRVLERGPHSRHSGGVVDGRRLWAGHRGYRRHPVQHAGAGMRGSSSMGKNHEQCDQAGGLGANAGRWNNGGMTAALPATRPQSEQRHAYRRFRRLDTRWMDNDAYGHLNNVVYYSLFDTAVNAMLIEAGVLDIQRGAVIGLVVETHCNFFGSIAFPQAVDAGIRVGQIGESSVRYEIGLFADGASETAARGHFVHVYVERESRRPTPLPAPLRRLLDQMQNPPLEPA